MMQSSPTHRIESIDLLRGLVMVLMTLDHARDFLGNAFFSATDLTVTTVPLFLSRWITHLCAPTFLLLAGCSIWLQATKGNLPAVRKFLLTRGLVLVLLELTLVHLVWYLHLDLRYAVAGVIWACGWSMVMMSVLVGLPKYFLIGFGIFMVAFQPLLATWLPVNLFTDVLLRTEDHEWMTGFHFYTSYPVLPWLGLMCIGYGLGSIFQQADAQRRKVLTYLSVTLLIGFIVLRLLSIGNPTAWQHFEMRWQTVLSFINLEKYPPSLNFCVLTIGLSLLISMVLERTQAWFRKVLLILGRAPLMYYLLHVLTLHLIAIAYSGFVFGQAKFLLSGPQIFWYEPLQGHPEGYGLPLIGVYAVTLLVVVALLPILHRYSRYKREHLDSVWRFI